MLTENETSTSDRDKKVIGHLATCYLDNMFSGVIIGMLFYDFSLQLKLSIGVAIILTHFFVVYFLESFSIVRKKIMQKSEPDYHTHLSNLIKIIGSLGAEHGHSLNPEFKKQFEDAKKLLQ